MLITKKAFQRWRCTTLVTHLWHHNVLQLLFCSAWSKRFQLRELFLHEKNAQNVFLFSLLSLTSSRKETVDGLSVAWQRQVPLRVINKRIEDRSLMHGSLLPWKSSDVAAHCQPDVGREGYQDERACSYKRYFTGWPQKTYPWAQVRWTRSGNILPCRGSFSVLNWKWRKLMQKL